MGDFKLGDNIAFNLKTLAILYRFWQSGNALEKRHLLKPMIVLEVSIIEAVLYDFHERIKKNTREGIASLPNKVLDYIREKKLDELDKYIVSARKHDLFDLHVDFYKDLEELRKLRNRVHIQNTKKHFEADDFNAFSVDRLRLCERALEAIMLTMAAKYPRDQNHVETFNLPWDAHFANGNIG